MSPRVRQVTKFMYFHIWRIGKVRLHLDSDTCRRRIVRHGLPDTLINSLQMTAAARLVTGTKEYDLITPVLLSFQWLKEQDCVKNYATGVQGDAQYCSTRLSSVPCRRTHPPRAPSLLTEGCVTQCPQSAQVRWGQSIQCHSTKAMMCTK